MTTPVLNSNATAEEIFETFGRMTPTFINKQELAKGLGLFCDYLRITPAYPATTIRQNYKALLKLYSVNPDYVIANPQQYVVVLKPQFDEKGIVFVTFEAIQPLLDHLDACKVPPGDVITIIDLETNTELPFRTRVWVG